MKDFQSFYGSTAWKETRRAFASSRRGLCEICLSRGIIKPGEIVHHKIHLTAENVNDPSVSLNWDNLQLLCRDCHGQQHKGQRRYSVDDDGKIVF